MADTIAEIHRLSIVRESWDDVHRVTDEAQREIAAHSHITLQFGARQQHPRPEQSDDETDQPRGHGRGRGRARGRRRARRADDGIGDADTHSFDQISAAASPGYPDWFRPPMFVTPAVDILGSSVTPPTPMRMRPEDIYYPTAPVPPFDLSDTPWSSIQWTAYYTSQITQTDVGHHERPPSAFDDRGRHTRRDR
ncbi:hypothetical protein Dimus_038456 [Dionaea muscipula]